MEEVGLRSWDLSLGEGQGLTVSHVDEAKGLGLGLAGKLQIPSYTLNINGYDFSPLLEIPAVNLGISQSWVH